MKKLLSAGFLILGMAAAFAASTVNPNIPTPGSALSSAPIRANFAATYNDINAIQARFPASAADGGFGSDISAQSGVPLFASGVPTFTGTTGTGNFARATSPTFSGTTVIGSGSVLNTPASLTLTNATGLPIGGLSGLGANVASWLATPSSANLAAAVTDETGTGSLVFNNVPVFIAPVLGAATGNSLALNTCVLGSHAFCATGTADISGAVTVGSLTASTPIAPASGGTNNGFFAVTGPTSSTKTFTFPNASATVLTTNAAVTVGQGGTGIASGTSGGVPYFNSTSTMASSGALTANLPVIGGGAGAAPTVGTRSGNTTQFASVAAGAKTSGNVATWDANGNIQDGGPIASQTVTTFTPTLTFGGGSTGMSLTGVVGRSVKTGKQVTVQISFLVATRGSSTGVARIGNLPDATFTASGLFSDYFAIVTNGAAGAQFVYFGELGSGASAVDMYYRFVSTGAQAQATHADFPDNTYVSITLNYITN